MGSWSVWHWLVVAVVFMALFGYKKLPEAARNLGRGLRIFKSEMTQLRDDDRSASRPSGEEARGEPVTGEVLPPRESQRAEARSERRAEPDRPRED